MEIKLGVALAGAPRNHTKTPSSGKKYMSSEHLHFLAKSLHYLQENIRRSGKAAAACYTLVGAIVLVGGAGYVIDLWQDTSPWFLFIGLMLGIIVGFYELAKTVWEP